MRPSSTVRPFASAPVLRLLVIAIAACGLFAACDLSEGTKYGSTPPSSANLPRAPDDSPLDGGVLACEGGVPDAGACSVSFANDIWPNILSATGRGACAQAACHGNTYPPVFQDAPSAYASLSAEVTAGRPYITRCSTDVDASAIYCNLLRGEASCGNVMPLGAPLAPADLELIRTWVQCGAPNN
jgi:hypothetical protein